MLTADMIRYFGGVASEIKGEIVPLGDSSSAIPVASRWASSAASCRGTRRWPWAR